MLVRLKPIDLRMKEKSSYIQDHLCSCSILSFYHIYVHSSNSKFKLDTWLRWWLRGKEPACQCRRHMLDPWSGKIPHAAGQLSPCATTTEPVLWSASCKYWARGSQLLKSAHSGACASQGKPLQWEACAELDSSPTCPSWRKPTRTKTQCSHIETKKLLRLWDG